MPTNVSRTFPLGRSVLVLLPHGLKATQLVPGTQGSPGANAVIRRSSGSATLELIINKHLQPCGTTKAHSGPPVNSEATKAGQSLAAQVMQPTRTARARGTLGFRVLLVARRRSRLQLGSCDTADICSCVRSSCRTPDGAVTPSGSQHTQCLPAGCARLVLGHAQFLPILCLAEPPPFLQAAWLDTLVWCMTGGTGTIAGAPPSSPESPHTWLAAWTLGSPSYTAHCQPSERTKMMSSELP